MGRTFVSRIEAMKALEKGCQIRHADDDERITNGDEWGSAGLTRFTSDRYSNQWEVRERCVCECCGHEHIPRGPR